MDSARSWKTTAIRWHSTFTITSAAFTRRFALRLQWKRALTDHIWTLEELCSLLPEKKPKPAPTEKYSVKGAGGISALEGFMAKPNQVSIPYVDPSVQHVGISKLRALNVTQLRALDKTLVIQDNDEPLAVLLKYEHFLAMQEKIGDE